MIGLVKGIHIWIWKLYLKCFESYCQEDKSSRRLKFLSTQPTRTPTPTLGLWHRYDIDRDHCLIMGNICNKFDQNTLKGLIFLVFTGLYYPPLSIVTLPSDLHTCEPSDGRINSPVFLGHLPFSNILPYSPDFYMFLPYSPDFYMFTSQMCNLHHMHLGQGSKMQFEWHISGILNP